MKIADLAKELKITEKYINDKIHALKLRSKDGGEITAVVEMILRDALADEGIVIVLKRGLGRAAVTPALVGHPAKLIG